MGGSRGDESLKVAEEYSRRADEYIAVVGKIEHADPQDREYVLVWARSVRGRVLDVGCGPGQWTNLLQQEGIDIEGLDPAAAFIADAKKRYPLARFRAGRAQDLGVENQSLGGVLAWFSLIHTDLARIGEPLSEFARALAPGGSLLLGFFAGECCEPFDHAVTTAYYWPPELLVKKLELAGFTVVDSRVRDRPGSRSEGLILARR